MSDKTEQPTPKRMREAREKGDVCKSQDIAPALTVLGIGIYLLANGKIGVIGHQCFHELDEDGINQMVYFNVAFEFDPDRFVASETKIIGTRKCYPASPIKREDRKDTAFTSGIVMRPDGKADLYSGISDAEEGRICIDYPFSAPLA